MIEVDTLNNLNIKGQFAMQCCVDPTEKCLLESTFPLSISAQKKVFCALCRDHPLANGIDLRLYKNVFHKIPRRKYKSNLAISNTSSLVIFIELSKGVIHNILWFSAFAASLYFPLQILHLEPFSVKKNIVENEQPFVVTYEVLNIVRNQIQPIRLAAPRGFRLMSVDSAEEYREIHVP